MTSLLQLLHPGLEAAGSAGRSGELSIMLATEGNAIPRTGHQEVLAQQTSPSP